MSNPLIPIKNANPKELFAPGGLESILSRIETDARALVPDTSTAKGRKAIASNAAKIAKCKTYLDGLGKDYVAEIKKLPKEIDEQRRLMRTRLDSLRDEVRRPLTELEEREAQRQAFYRDQIAEIKAPPLDLTEVGFRAKIKDLEALDIDESWDEFREEASAARDAQLYQLNKRLQELQEARERAEKERREREERIAKEAAERARKAAEKKAEKERREAEERAARERQEIEERAKRERLEAERRAREALEQREREERERREREEQQRREQEERIARAAAETARLEAERRAEEQRKEAEERHRKEIAEAAEKAKRGVTRQDHVDVFTVGGYPDDIPGVSREDTRTADYHDNIIFEVVTDIREIIDLPDTDIARLLRAINDGKIRHLRFVEP